MSPDPAGTVGTTTARVVVDGSNLATEGRTLPSLRQLDEAVRAYAEEDPDAEIVVVVDASFEHRIDPSERAQLADAELHGEVVSPPAGAIGRGDAFVLRIAERSGARVLSNDSFQEFHAEHPWLFDEGRLVGGKPVPGVGWIFTPRIPVRGPKSRQVTSKAKGAARAARAAEAAEASELSPPVKAAELAKAARKVAARRAAVGPGGERPKIGDVLPGSGPRVSGAASADGGKAAKKAARKSSGKKAPAEEARTEEGAPEGAGVEAAAGAAAPDGKGKAPAKKSAKKAPAKKAAAKKAAAEQAPAKKAARKSSGKKAPAEEARTEEGAPEGTGVEAARAEAAAGGAAPDGKGKAPAKKAARKSSGKKTPAEEARTEEGAPEAARAGAARAEAAAGGAAPNGKGKAPAKKAAAKKAPAQTAAKKAPAQTAPAQTAARPDEGTAVSAPAVEEGVPAGLVALDRALHDQRLQEAISEATVEALSLPAEARAARAGVAGDGAKVPKRGGKGAKRRRRRAAEPPPAVNEPLAFINFVAAYPLGSEVEGEVVSFTSHGAMVDVDLPGGGALHCYIPLSAMASPPPSRARQVLSRGERRSFVLTGLDPPRRVAELGMAGTPARTGR